MRVMAFRICCLLQLLAICAPCATALAQPTGALDPLLQPYTLSFTGRTNVIVVARDASLLGAVALLIQQLGGSLGRSLPIINAYAATVPNIFLKALASSPSVQHVALDRPIVGAMERTGPTIGAPAVRQEFGLDGSGIGVAVIDSGITAWHDDLSGTAFGSQRVDRFVDFVGGSTTPSDAYGHGTHVAGIIAGNGFDSGGARSGIAPAARLIALKVLDGSGQGQISNVIAALDYAVSHRTELNIRIVNMSVGSGVYESFNTDPLTLAAKVAVDSGIVVVASAGNNGRNAQGAAQYFGITAPGNAPWVLTVGASSTMGTIDRSDDTVAAFSSRGPTAVDLAAKPDLVAPGVGTESLSVPNSTLYNMYSAYLLSGTTPTWYLPYLSLSGTSQAAPVVAGTVALMLQANPALTPNAVKAALQFTAQIYPGYDPLTQGAGFLNALGAVELAHYLAAPSTVPYPVDTTWSHQVLWGNQSVMGGRLTANVNAWLTGTLWGALSAPSSGLPIAWGVICSTLCDSPTAVWNRWGLTCTDSGCTSPDWGDLGSQNVVWGTSDDNETVVWGTNDNETVVWGTSCSDPSCGPVIWNNNP
jgi:serine protease AprX